MLPTHSQSAERIALLEFIEFIGLLGFTLVRGWRIASHTLRLRFEASAGVLLFFEFVEFIRFGNLLISASPLHPISLSIFLDSAFCIPHLDSP